MLIQKNFHKFATTCIFGHSKPYILRMKRKNCLILVSILCLLSLAFCLVACNKKPHSEQNGNVSRLTEAYYAGESDLFAVSIEKGKREKTFIADGIAKDVCPFTELVVTPLKSNDFEVISYVISADDKTLSGEVKCGKGGEFVASIALDFVPKTITLSVGDTKSDIELNSILQGKLSSLDVINIAKEALKDNIAKEYAEGKPEREIYLKLITADRESYYYYVSFISEGVDYWAMLIDPSTGNIISKK